VTLPPVAWKRPAGALLAALVFLGVGVLLPLPARQVRPANAAAAAKVAAVQAKAEALAREEPLGSPLEEELRRLSEEVAEGRFDSADWEAADSLEKSLEARAAKAAAELAAASEAARELEESLDAAAGAEAATREREALENALMALGSDNAAQGQQGQQNENPSSGNSGGGPGAGDGGTGQARAKQGGSGGGARSRDEVASLRETLERRQRELEQRFGQGAGRNGSRPGEGEGEGEGQGRQGGHASRQTKPGKGGTGRGGESQPLVFGEKAEMDPERLSFKPLPQGQGGEAQGLWGLRSAEPQRREGGGGGGGQGAGAQGDAEAGHSEGPLLPRNRELVKRYFGGEP